MHIARTTGLAMLLLAMNQVAIAQRPSAWYQQQLEAISQSNAIMKRADHYEGLLTQYQVMLRAYAADRQPAFRTIFRQYLSWYQTFMGDYKDAENSFSIPQRALRDDAPSPPTIPGEHPVKAVTYIPQLAKSYRVVFLNEAHNIALTRTLTVRLLKPLREEGFNTFAVETLNHRDITALATRGYPTAASGYYIREPIYAEMVRTALKLGYRVVAYDTDRQQSVDAREAQQAENLWKILKDDPKARLVVNAGYSHIEKTGKFLGAHSMAEYFIKDSALNPLSVEQTILVPHQNRSMDHPDYGAIIDTVHPLQPIVFVDKNGKPWSLRPGYDISVIFPEEHFRLGRPTWLALWGLRVPYPVYGSVCHGHYPCIVSARYDDESDDAIPADRMVLDPVPEMTIDDVHVTSGEASTLMGELYLRPGRYRLVARDQNGALLMRQAISVPEGIAAPPASSEGRAALRGKGRIGHSSQ
ncbi:MAG: hypothetical protein ACREPL_04355 [Rhodanobacteraceae bacterium]